MDTFDALAHPPGVGIRDSDGAGDIMNDVDIPARYGIPKLWNDMKKAGWYYCEFKYQTVGTRRKT